MTENKFVFHTFSLSTDRQLKVILRGVPDFYSESEVKSEIESLGYSVSHIHQFNKEIRELPIFLIILPNSKESKMIFDLQPLFYVSIKLSCIGKQVLLNVFHVRDSITPAIYTALTLLAA